MVGRRALLLAGGAAVVAAGCGKDETAPPPSPAQVMLRGLAFERALAHELQDARGMRRRIALRALERARRLAAAISEAGGDPHDVRAPDTPPDPSAALGRGQAALEAHVTALPVLHGAQRALGIDLLIGAAADAALLGAPDDAFPGTPS